MAFGDRDYADRWNPGLRTVEAERPIRSVASTTIATGELNSQHRVTEHPAGFVVRERGALGSTVRHAYRCPVHGEFDAKVPRDAVPDEMPCPESEPAPWNAGDPRENEYCGRTSHWSGSHAGQGVSSGEVAS